MHYDQAFAFLLNLPSFIVALVVHEFAHGFVALKLGDETAQRQGRLTLNPLAHIDLLGTILLPLFLILSGAPYVFGWARPVPVNFFNLRDPKRHMILVGLAGPAANFLLAFIVAHLLRSGIFIFSPLVIEFLFSVYVINIILGLFNLIPLPPLDGSHVLMGFLPERYAQLYARMKPLYGMIIIVVVISLLRHWR